MITGSVLKEVIDAVDVLETEGISASVASVFSLKPFDMVSFLQFASGVSRLVVVEEHSVTSGLGNIATEEIYTDGILKPVTKIGLEDCFTKGYGTVATVRKENGLDATSIVMRIKKEIS